MMFRHGEFVFSHKPFYVAVIIATIAIIGKLVVKELVAIGEIFDGGFMFSLHPTSNFMLE